MSSCRKELKDSLSEIPGSSSTDVPVSICRNCRSRHAEVAASGKKMEASLQELDDMLKEYDMKRNSVEINRNAPQ